MPGHWIVDRIEDGFAVLVRAAETREVSASRLPVEAREGSALVEGADGLRMASAAAESDLDDACRRLDRLRSRDPGDDLDL